jgi:hypothetical protein
MRALRLLDLCLVAVVALLAWQLRREWISAHARQQALLDLRIQSTAVPGLTPLREIEPPVPADYAEVAAKNLFSRDRNPNVIVDPPAPPPEKPVPPFPVAHGVMLWPGMPPTVVLSEKPGGLQKGYHPDEKIGDWKIDTIDRSFLVLEWNGKQFNKRIDELVEKTPTIAAETAQPQQASRTGPGTPANAEVARQMAEAAAAAASAKPAQSLSPDTIAGPGLDSGGGYRSCIAGDPAPAGTVVGGLRKVVTQTPFGASCRWEPAK